MTPRSWLGQVLRATARSSALMRLLAATLSEHEVGPLAANVTDEPPSGGI
ncbi:MAG: hypothetical protein AVDCRST_MAG43-416 [uncultured Thermomicrobiales bacterium]|uniref:Uncharacterized protein n=1 Tax=uncultured Thermomicrobiales bacterium TaxID=1645740 RepID=A0A6J4UAG1_9BACT|nr:MAG: hypothetical protein AVDCRST_MAG43-416 [uncultured Thermomicrobiales bacterium]